MIGMQMRDEQARQIGAVPLNQASLMRLNDALDDAVAAIEEIGLVIDGDRDAGADAIGFGVGCAAAEDDDLRPAHSSQSRRR